MEESLIEKLSKSKFLIRESGGSEKVLHALISREIALEKIRESGGTHQVEADVIDEYHAAARNAEELKRINGIQEPDPEV